MTIVVLVLLSQAPKLDGRYVPEEVAKAIAADTFSSLDTSTGVSFGKTSVQLGWGMETEERPWQWTKAGLLVRGQPVTWKVLRDGSVETDLRGELERLVFLPGVTQASLERRLQARHQAAFLRGREGEWRAPGHTLLLGKSVTLDGRASTLRAYPCALSCEVDTLCAEVKHPKASRSFAATDGGLVEISLEGLCGELKTGVELVDGGLRLQRAP
ncbi:MAG: hypothetical protein AB1938_19790 [Myxococcota bacterium]